MATEYISREAVLASLKRIKKSVKGPYPEYATMAFYEFEDLVDAIQAADVVRVVRCRDCTYFKDSICENRLGLPFVNENKYCSMGTRKRDGDI